MSTISTPPLSEVQQRILDTLDRYPILSPSLLYSVLQNSSGIDIIADARILREVGLIGSLPPQEESGRSAYRYYAAKYQQTLQPFIEGTSEPRFYGERQERIARALMLYPILTPSLLCKCLHAAFIDLEETLSHMHKEDIIRSFRPGTVRVLAPRYYLSAYEAELTPFFPG